MIKDQVKIEDKKKEKIEVLMPKGMKEVLKSLYLLRSYSGFEEPVRNFIIKFLTDSNIPYVNFNGNILGLNHPGAPLFSAHMDMVNTENYKLAPGESIVENAVFTIDDQACIRLYRKDGEDKRNQTSLGADDKNGIWVILMLLSTGHKINFAFCHSEEVGGTGSTQIAADTDCAKFISECQYGVIIDRKNSSDIIGYQNKYCMGLDDRLHAFAKENGFKYSPARGSISDADRFSNYVECVNLSCGYYCPHTSSEYTNLNELYMTYRFCGMMLESFEYHSVSKSRMQEFKGTTSQYSSYTTRYTSTAKKAEDDKKSTVVEDDGDWFYNYNRGTYEWRAKSKDSDEKKNSETKAKITTTDTDMKTTTPVGTTDKSKSTFVPTSEEIVKQISASAEAAVVNALYNYPSPADSMDDEGGMAIPEANCFLVPLYTGEYFEHHDDAEPEVSLDCPECYEEIHLTTKSLDFLKAELDTSYAYNSANFYGYCRECNTIYDIKGLLDFLI